MKFYTRDLFSFFLSSCIFPSSLLYFWMLLIALTLGNSATRYRPNYLHHHHNEEASTVSLKQFFHNFISNSGNFNQLLVWLLSFDLIFGGQGLSLKGKDGYGKLNDDDKSWGDDCENLWKSYPRVPLGSCYLPPVHPQHKENNVSLFTTLIVFESGSSNKLLIIIIFLD